MDLIFGIIVGLLVIVFLVVVHELGHAIAARRSGVRVEEFGIGFPPRALGKKLKNGILFSLNWLPLGGFVRLQGEYDSSSGKGDYGAATFWQKTKILLAGVVINWLVAAGILSILAWIGLPQILPNQFNMAQDMSFENKGDVTVVMAMPGYPAEKAGLKEGDVIEKFAGQEVTTVEKLIDLTHEHRGETVEVVYGRDDNLQTKKVTLRDTDQGSVLGAGLSQMQYMRYTWSAPIVGVVTTAQFTWVTLEGLGNLVVDFFGGLAGKLSFNETTRESASEQLDRAGASVAGPIGILGVIFPEASQAGLTQVLLLAAIISLTLAVINALPIPGLDGGRWFTMAVFRLFKKPLTKQREEAIQGAGIMILMALIMLITIADVVKLF
jgi:regulator of sigma E protease